ncbi:MAG: RNA-binding transcriptional accessory protein [Bacteroides sp.]|nr:RNA-binding transcriptional accessory protein [Roseburia sp.]MCM1347753.1 RNA-binding transcriptional accessory protein [Bacteroides sp.]MCM1420489.1 RNA-binding transcriptional accessory protein [Bacteroides sp.]
MNAIFSRLIGQELGIQEHRVKNTLALLEEGCTIPFISRYRKEMTGALDEVQVAAVSDKLNRLKEVEKRKQTILSAIEEQGKLTEELKRRIEQSWDSTELEDIYMPYKPKRRTRAEVARQKGLEPLAQFLMLQTHGDVERKAADYVCMEKEVTCTAEALKGAMDIIAETVSENESARNIVRNNFRHGAVISSKQVKGKELEGQKFRDYFDFSEKLSRCASHRLLAMRRGEAEGVLRVSINGDDEACMERLKRLFVRNTSESARYVADAVTDSFKRLLKPSIETEFATLSKETADKEAIRIFVHNLEQLLMSPPLGQKRVLAIDPGFRTGCKVVCLDAEGNLLHNEAIFPHPPKHERTAAANKLWTLVRQYKTEAISIGNGTASRETEDFVRGLGLPPQIQVYVVSEDGASIYSASKVAREEFPDYDVTVRGAVSIGRRLMDPLAELVKIEPDSVGVGQYQKDVNQTELKHALDQTVVNCVNKVGVNVNTASKHLLTYVSGLGVAIAQNIVKYRAENGAFKSRRELLKVPKLGPKAFEQSAGFLRIEEGIDPLDNSAVHPESYHIVEKMAHDQHCTVAELMADKEIRMRIDLSAYVSDKIGLPTLEDIMKELEKPSRDPRQPLTTFAFDASVKELKDVKEGMVLPGIVTNITNFGCFVDVGVHTKGLVHISELTDRFVKDPTEVVQLHQHVRVRVISVDMERGRLALSMKGM